MLSVLFLPVTVVVSAVLVLVPSANAETAVAGIMETAMLTAKAALITRFNLIKILLKYNHARTKQKEHRSGQMAGTTLCVLYFGNLPPLEVMPMCGMVEKVRLAAILQAL